MRITPESQGRREMQVHCILRITTDDEMRLPTEPLARHLEALSLARRTATSAQRGKMAVRDARGRECASESSR